MTRTATSRSRTALAVRVAAYARISVADRDGAAFTSIEAQVDSVTSYIRAQAASGWQLVEEPYVDDGFTGGNAKRPALQRLLDDVRGGLLDAVVVHRFDRFSRSQRDFLNLLHVLDQHDVAFVSVNETLDTSTPMGRCMLGVMTAFAQLERETIAARTKTKMLAARRKGMWTGGRPILGYDVVDKRLVVNPEEAERVRAIFALYLELGSIMLTVDELKRRGWGNKSWTANSGRSVPSSPFSKDSLHSLLTTPLYVGRIRAGDEVVEAQHEAIVDLETWEAVRDRRISGRRSPGRCWRPSKHADLLAGLVYCAACGRRFVYHYSQKGRERRHLYLVCGTAQKQGAAACPGSRAPAGAFEQFVLDQIKAVGSDPALLEATLAADRETRAARLEEVRAEVQRLSGQRGALETQRRNLVDAVAAGGSARALNARLADLEDEANENDEALATARTEERALARTQIDPAELARALRQLDGIWDALFPVERARLMALLVARIEYEARSGDVAITFRDRAHEALEKAG